MTDFGSRQMGLGDLPGGAPRVVLLGYGHGGVLPGLVRPQE
jgi:hypothetical protein